jgi:hypothetical protein
MVRHILLSIKALRRPDAPAAALMGAGLAFWPSQPDLTKRPSQLKVKDMKYQKVTYYVEAWTSLGDEESFESRDEAIAWLKERTTPLGEGWVLEHEHAPDVEECACVQYLNSHLPVVVNGEESHD